MAQHSDSILARCIALGVFGALIGLTAMARPASAQEAVVSGRVIDSATSQPVAGANVVVKGTTTGMTANSNGEFRLRPRTLDDTLVVRFIGYTEAIVPIAGRSEITITLSPRAIGLSAVVTVGYGTQRRSDITGSVTSLSSARLNDQPTTNVVEALAGAMPGVNVTTTGSSAEGSFDIQIRGQKSITASNAPLVVIDGIPFGGLFSELNPSEIESVDVLKDASAAAIYGARGSNGVILVTTKHGSGKPTFSYSGKIGAADVVNLPRMMTAQEFGVFKCTHLNNGIPCASDSLIASKLTASELANYVANTGTDWVDLATRRGLQQQQTLSFSGGDDDTRYYLSGGLLNNQGVAKNDSYRRYDVRFNFSQNVKSWLTVGTNTQLALLNRDGVAASFSDAFQQNPLNSAFDSTGAQLIYPWPEDVFFSNPLEGLLATNKDRTKRVFTANYAQVDIPWVQGLAYRVNAGIDYEGRNRGTYYGRNTETGLSSLGDASTADVDRYEWTLENLLTYKRAFGNHGIDVTGLFSQASDVSQTNSLSSNGFPNDVLTYYQANVGQSITPSYSYSETGIVSEMLRLNYTYADRYLFTATVRRDGFSAFGADHKYGVFPSFALGWNVAQESFWPFARSVPTFKIRATWGENGNQAISAYRTLATLSQLHYVDGTTTAPGYLPASLANPDLHWETTAQTNLGIDFGFLNDRINGSLDLYKSKTHDLLLNRTISAVQGINSNSVIQNIGKTENRGIELSLTTRNIQGPKFSWETTFNISANRNKIVDLYGDGEDDIANGWFIGKPIDVSYGYIFDGIWQQADSASGAIAASGQPTAKPGDIKVKDSNGDGVISAADRQIRGNLQPDYTAGLTNTFRVGPVSLSAFFNTVQGIWRVNPLLSPTLTGPQVRYNTVATTWWTADNPINTYPANREGVNPLSVGFIQNSSFVRLQDLMLGYDLPTRFWPGAIQRARLYVDGKNLWTATSWTGLDPEFTSGNQRGVPLARTIILGLDLGF